MNPIAAHLFVASGLLGFLAIAFSLAWHRLDNLSDAKLDAVKNAQAEAAQKRNAYVDFEKDWQVAYKFQRRVNFIRGVGIIFLYFSFALAFLALIIQGVMGMS